MMIHPEIHFHYQAMIMWLHHHPRWGWLIAFLVTFSESVAIIGTIVPGTITMTAIGMLIGSGVLPLQLTLIWAILGAILGDAISFLIGHFFKKRLPYMWPFSKHPLILQSGSRFIKKHGGKSIFIGRFVGPVRAIIPLIAGMLDMRPPLYFLASIPAAICWAPLYMLPGILVGAASLEMPPDVATEVILSVFFLLVIIWSAIKGVSYLFNKTHHYFAKILDKRWTIWRTEPSKRWICYLLRHARRPQHRGQILLAISSFTSLIFFIIIAINVIWHGPLLGWNDAFYHLFRGMHTQILTKIFVIITPIGSPHCLAVFFIIMFIWFLIQRRISVAIHWLMGGGICMASVLAFKVFYFSPRPPGLLYHPTSSTFPSGHTAVSIILYGLLAFFIADNRPSSTRKIIYWSAAIVSGSIGLSRLYLGAHWLTDVMAATFLALSILGFTIISYHRNIQKRAPLWSTLIVSFIALFIINTVYLSLHYKTDLHNYQLYWKTNRISYQEWWNQTSKNIPLYRTNRLNHPIEILNIQWLSSPKTIQQILTRQGWQGLNTRDYVNTLEKLAKQHHQVARSVIPKLYSDRDPVLEMAKLVNGKFPPLVLRLWQSNLNVSNTNRPLIVGTLTYDTTEKRLLFFHHEAATRPSMTPYRALLQDLNTQQWITKEDTIKQPLPKQLISKQNTKIILIQPT